MIHRCINFRKEISNMNIKVYRVPQFSAKCVNVICVNDVPLCTVRGQKSTNAIITKLNGYDADITDGRIDRLIKQKLKEV